MAKILLVDDDPQSLASTRRILELEGFETVSATDGEKGLAEFRKDPGEIDLVITDVRMPNLGGVEFLRALLIYEPDLPVVLMTAYGRVEEAVWAMKLGAVDFLTKPFKRHQIKEAIKLALRRGARNRRSVEEDHILGNSESIQQVRRDISQIASTEATVLILGESGTGKELVARNIHETSSRSKGPFVALNCAAIPENLIESELFGHERGAFSGADRAKPGLFESAEGGTVLLDEIGDMPLSLQAKLLRVLQEGEVRRLGSSSDRKVNVRVLAATHQDLKLKVQKNEFREDLFFRLDVVEIKIPPLRDRREDISSLAKSFIDEFSRKHGKKQKEISAEALDALESYQWPGNVRELSNTVERAVVLSREDEILSEDLPEHISGAPQDHVRSGNKSISFPLGTSLKDAEDLLIKKTLDATSGDKNLAAKILGVNSRTIYRKLQK